MSVPYAEVIGDPIAHSKSPIIHNFWLQQLGIDAKYRVCHVRADELADYFAERRNDPAWRGCNVTIPHKERVASLIDSLRQSARNVGAVNTIFPHPDEGLCGINTDVDGVREALRGIDLSGRPLVVIGAGGAARAAFAHLEGVGCSELRVLARNTDKAANVVSNFDVPARTFHIEKAASALEGASLVINATQLGMQDQAAMPDCVISGLHGLTQDAIVFDMVYAPQETELLKAAAISGRYPVGGLVMLIGQARNAFARFFDMVPPYEHDDQLRRLLTA